MKTIGIIGGGQLGLMIAEQARDLLGVRTVCLDPAADAPAFGLCDDHIVAAYDDAAALEELCRRSDAVTYEFENVPGDILIPLEKKYNIPQGFRPLYDSQDRLRERRQRPCRRAAQARFRRRGRRSVAARRCGEDGPARRAENPDAGVRRARTAGAEDARPTSPGRCRCSPVPCHSGAVRALRFEASVVWCPTASRVVTFPIGRNVHRDGILDLCFVPAGEMATSCADGWPPQASGLC